MRRARFSIGGVISSTPGPTRITCADDNQGLGNTAKGVACPAYYYKYKWLSAQDSPAFGVQPMAHFRSLISRRHARAAERPSIKSQIS
jgi:hypothetical protein